MTMRLPPLLRSFSLAAIDDVLADIHGTSRLDFTPSHALTRIVDGVVLDVNRSDPWDLVSEGATATDARMVYGKPDFHSRSLETIYQGAHRWIAKSTAAFNFDSLESWSVMFPWRYDTEGVPGGAWMMGNLVGPRPDNPWYPTPTTYGADKGWAMSANGDGGCGVSVYGDTGADKWPNVDISAGLYNCADGRWRMVELGYSLPNTQAWLTVAHRTDEGAGVQNILYTSTTGIGNSTSPDGRFMLGQNYYGVAMAGLNGGVGLPLIAFEGTAADNRYAVRLAELPVLQAQLEAYEP